MIHEYNSEKKIVMLGTKRRSPFY